MVLFRPTIAALLRERDEAVAAWQRDHPGSDVLEDRDLEVTSQRRIAVAEQMDAIRSLLA